jgi:hypothetical protein
MVGIPKNNNNSLVERSTGMFLIKRDEKPNIIFIHDLKKNVGPNRYKKSRRKIEPRGKKSKKKEKNNISEIKKIDPGNPKNINTFNRTHKKSLGHIKFKPLISVIKRVLNLRAIASTRRKEFVDINAWLINIQKLANIKFD